MRTVKQTHRLLDLGFITEEEAVSAPSLSRFAVSDPETPAR